MPECQQKDEEKSIDVDELEEAAPFPSLRNDEDWRDYFERNVIVHKINLEERYSKFKEDNKNNHEEPDE